MLLPHHVLPATAMPEDLLYRKLLLFTALIV